ncbi:hypothetical protein EELLY_v1c03810 [Entomoplasma ellychniae]|uniref:Uncharacterized protein n=1 Tax=Entomoplasma ellychniae TaxID=2114 RepID=A0A8E2QVZ6_9MOLU|nr:hypothetical protein [Entomoplasma ellychniae]PPE04338.1 hypothetical protein EELLY_v1c00120 [Entomoplasma ellychniae]PPE04630.1 hypothetical protein EELLY_v1c03100 [Entomoplasma ellychniae]PPE04701.1 hypothetical protein EELLY_v1c03810 [Entomoplasma ellychniae]
MLKEKEIWLGYSESPGDYSDNDLKLKHWRPLLITKVYSGTSLIRVTEASTKLKQKYIIDVVLSSGQVFQFDKGSSYIIDAKSLKQKLKPLIGPAFDKKYKYIKRSSNYSFNKIKNKVNFEKMILSGEYNNLSTEEQDKQRIWKQFSLEEQENRMIRKIEREEKLKLMQENKQFQIIKKSKRHNR